MQILDGLKMHGEVCPTLCQLMTLMCKVQECKDELLSERNVAKITDIYRDLKRKALLQRQRNRPGGDQKRKSVHVQGGGLQVTDMAVCFQSVKKLMKYLGISE